MQKLFVLLMAAFSTTPFIKTAASYRPDWAFPPNGPQISVTLYDNKPMHVPGSSRTYTRDEINYRVNAVDWFPDQHPPMPDIVARGNDDATRIGCAVCHLPQGLGHPDDARLAGSTVAYLTQQLASFKGGSRVGEGTATMVALANKLSEEDALLASEYFAALKPVLWTRVIETETVPRTHFQGLQRLPDGDNGTEPIGNRIIEIPEDQMRMWLRDPHAGFVTYVPAGTLAVGKSLVESGGNGKTVSCGNCHGLQLTGTNDVPNIAGRTASEIARALYYYQIGDRGGAAAAAMKPVVEKLTADDALAVTAYVASLPPQ